MANDDVDMRASAGPHWIRQTQEALGEGVFEVIDYRCVGYRRVPWWAFWRDKEQVWQQVGPARQEVRLDDAIGVWIRAAWDRDFGGETDADLPD